MDNEQERNEHFKGFARLLIHDLATVHDEIGYRSAEDSEKLIAQRAYDFMEHIMLYAPAAPVPDMTEWP